MPFRDNKMILKGFEQHFILLSFLTVVTGLVLMIAAVIGIMWLIDPMLLGGASLEDTLYVSALGFILLAATYYYTLRIDHRVSGPVFVLLRNLDRLGGGDLTAEMRLRQQDHLQEISDSYNQNIKSLREQLHGIKATARQLRDGGDNKELIDQLVADLDKIKTEN